MAFLAALGEGGAAAGAAEGGAAAEGGGVMKNLGGLFGGGNKSANQFRPLPNIAEGEVEYHMDSGAK